MNAISIASLVLTLLAIPVPEPEPPKPDPSPLEGTWAIVRFEAGGVVGQVPNLDSLSLKFTGNRFATSMDGREISTGFITLRPRRQPAEIDATMLGERQDPKGPTQISIYRIEGDELHVCTAPTDQARPTSFDDAKKPGFVLVVLKRQTKQ